MAAAKEKKRLRRQEKQAAKKAAREALRGSSKSKTKASRKSRKSTSSDDDDGDNENDNGNEGADESSGPSNQQMSRRSKKKARGLSDWTDEEDRILTDLYAKYAGSSKVFDIIGKDAALRYELYFRTNYCLVVKTVKLLKFIVI